MADKTNLQLVAEKSGEELTTTITNANPAAADTDLYDFAVALNSLTSNTFIGVNRMDVTALQAGE